MELWFAAVLGVVQGLTEFLPISSTAHLRIVPAALGEPDPGAAFTAVIQLGTLLAVIGYFLRELLAMARAAVTAPRSPEARLLWLMVAGTVPIGVAGVTLKDTITGDLRALAVVATALIVVGIVMGWVDRGAHGRRTLAELTLVDALVVGGAQALALVPGVSRSGATITCALLIGLTRADAARWSFLLSVPAIAAAGLFEMHDAAAELGAQGTAPLLVASAAAAVTGYASIAWLIAHLRTRSLIGFAVYRVILGGAILLYLALA
jgi:undecaprenyl-diphosphatase